MIKSFGIVHCIVECEDCGWTSHNHKNAQASANMRNLVILHHSAVRRPGTPEKGGPIDMALRELALFAGAGGGLLGAALLGWRTVAAVEKNPYRRELLLRRQYDEMLPLFPIWDNIKTFDGKPFRGRVDVVTGGFPCQPFSVAGKKQGEDDPRNMWPDTIRIICEVGPRFCFLENVPGLLANEYFGQILGELAESGYGVRWDCISAAACGGCHTGERLWVLATANENDDDTNDQIYTNPNFEVEIWSHNKWPDLQNAKTTWLLSNAYAVRKNYDVAPWVDRYEAIGDGQVPRVFAEAWRVLRGTGCDWFPRRYKQEQHPNEGEE